ncbi:MAG: hypothetical protein HZB22_01610 [Deltaproteobacteria bacterium]|nr:hypothetical protein [Deltaproteobacteria bacterium]
MGALTDTTIIVLLAFAVFLLISIGTVFILWIAMPFSVFGTKKLLKRLIEEQERTNKLLVSVIDACGRREDFYKEIREFPEKIENTH